MGKYVIGVGNYVITRTRTDRIYAPWWIVVGMAAERSICTQPLAEIACCAAGQIGGDARVGEVLD
jgi:hypothetical protein